MFIETRIRLNVGGHRYETTLETLRKHPQTLLGKLFPVDQEVPMTDDNGEYFFDRDGEPFGIILNFYRNDGKLFWPRTWDRFSPETLAAELAYFQIPFEAAMIPAPQTPSLDEVVRTLPSVRRFTTDIDEECAHFANEIMKTYGELLVKPLWTCMNMILYPKEDEEEEYSDTTWTLEFRILMEETGNGRLTTCTLSNMRDLYSTQKAFEFIKDVTDDVLSDDLTRLDWAPLVEFFSNIKRDEFTREMALSGFRKEFYKTLLSALKAYEEDYDYISVKFPFPSVNERILVVPFKINY